MEESSAQTSRFSQFFAVQQEGSELKVNGLTLLNGVTRNEYYISQWEAGQSRVSMEWL